MAPLGDSSFWPQVSSSAEGMGAGPMPDLRPQELHFRPSLVVGVAGLYGGGPQELKVVGWQNLGSKQ